MTARGSVRVCRGLAAGALLACACLGAHAQIRAVTPRGLTLGEALDGALERHPALRAADQGTVVARTGYASADAIGDLTINSTTTGQFHGPVTSISFPDGSGGTQTFQIGKPVTGSVSVDIAKPLNLGSQRRAARRAVDAQVRLAETGGEQARLGVLLGVKQTFYNVLMAEHLRLIALDAVDRTETHLRIAQAQFGAGTVAQFDVDRAEADVASARAQLASAEGAVRIALAYLASAMGADPSDRIEIRADLVPDFIAVDEAAAREVAHERPEVRRLLAQAELYRAQARQADLEDRPIVSAFGSTGYSIGSGFTEGTTYAVGLQVTIPFQNGHADEAREKTALAQAVQAETELVNETLTIDTAIRVALEGLATSRSSVEDAAQAVVKARDALTRVRLSYENQLAAWIDLRDAEAGLTASEQQYVTTLFRYRLAQSDLENAVGLRDLGTLATPDPAGPPTIPDMAGTRRPEDAPPIPERVGALGGAIAPPSAGGPQ